MQTHAHTHTIGREDTIEIAEVKAGGEVRQEVRIRPHCVRVCVWACVGACVRVCVHARARVGGWVGGWVPARVRASVCRIFHRLINGAAHLGSDFGLE